MFFKTRSFLGEIVSIILIIIAGNLLLLKEWARKAIIYFSICFTLTGLVWTILEIVNNPVIHDSWESFQRMNLIGCAGVAIIGTLWVVFYFTRPEIKDKFE